MFNQHGDCNFRRRRWRISDEPGIGIRWAGCSSSDLESSLLRLMTWEVPVLPLISISASRLPLAVPFSPLTTSHKPFRTNSRLGALKGILPITSGLLSFNTAVSRSDEFYRIMGLYLVPPLAIAEVKSTICSGVARLNPWPMATDRVSPLCQGIPVRFFFQAAVGINPLPSLPKLIPVRDPRPPAFAYQASRSTPNNWPT